MVKFIIAGRSDCPYYAKTELLGDVLTQSLDQLEIKKHVISPEAWSNWAQEKSSKLDQERAESPLVWRELADKGGHGLLIGGYNEFSEYAKLYYGIEYDLETERVKEIVTENKLTHIKKENEALKAKASMKPLVLAFISPFTSLAYNVSFILSIRYRLYHIVCTPGLIIVSADTYNIKFQCIGCSDRGDTTSNQFGH